MKKLIFPFILTFFVYPAFSQLIDIKAYDQLKKEKKLTGSEKITGSTDASSILKVTPADPSVQASSCDCWIERDGTWQVVPFQFGTPPDYRNDDGSTGLINLPFQFCLYGSNRTDAYINNNGNVSFGGAYSTFTANSFPDPTYIMVAPFWGDVDTRGPASGLVYYKMTSTYLIVQWEDVGYYNSYVDKLNTFQLIISDGSDPIIPNGNNVAFCYKDMQWTTGDASSGVGGFGGTPATVGVNRGNGVDYLQIGLFDAAGSAYDGPFGNNDGISFLDNQSYQFNVCLAGGTNNVPPFISSSGVCDTITLCIGDTSVISATFLSPEQGQTTTPGFNSNGFPGVTVLSSNSGNTADITIQVIPQPGSAGYYTVDFTATDDGTPAQTSSAPVVFDVQPSPVVAFSFQPENPQPGETVTFTDETTGGQGCVWDFGDGSPLQTGSTVTHVFVADSSYNVTLSCASAGGCASATTKTVETLSKVIEPNVITPNGDGKNDFLVFKNLERYPGSSLKLFGRWGNEIYSTSSYQNNWPSGSESPSDGVYYYILKVNGEEESRTGFIHILNN